MPELSRWIDLCRRMSGKGDFESQYNILKNLYSEKHRHYHTFSHIDSCLNEFDRSKHIAEHPNDVEFALWLHDAVYLPRQNNNEDASADLAYKLASEFGLPKESARRVKGLIIDTKHVSEPQETDGKIITDIDLAILGRPFEEFYGYEKKIRMEYAFVSDEEYRNGRSAILAMFLERPWIYSTEFFHDEYEIQARENLEWTLRRLNPGKIP